MLENLPAVRDFLQLLLMPELAVWWGAIFFFLGACFGSYMNVCIYRIPRLESVVNTPSHCPNCNASIAFYDNIPILSFLILRAKCRHCKWPIPPRYFILEMGMGLLFLSAWFQVLYWGLHPLYLPLVWGISWLSLGALIMDWRSRIIPDQITYPVLVLGLLGSLFFPTLVYRLSFPAFNPMYDGLLGACSDVLLVFLFLFFNRYLGRWIRGRETLGWGDIKMILAFVACLGLLFTAVALVLASVLGGLFVIYVMVSRKLKSRRITHIPAVPYGTFLGVASLAILVAKLVPYWLGI